MIDVHGHHEIKINKKLNTNQTNNKTVNARKLPQKNPLTTFQHPNLDSPVKSPV